MTKRVGDQKRRIILSACMRIADMTHAMNNTYRALIRMITIHGLHQGAMGLARSWLRKWSQSTPPSMNARLTRGGKIHPHKFVVFTWVTALKRDLADKLYKTTHGVQRVDSTIRLTGQFLHIANAHMPVANRHGW